jgi:hypothetical protein
MSVIKIKHNKTPKKDTFFSNKQEEEGKSSDVRLFEENNEDESE